MANPELRMLHELAQLHGIETDPDPGRHQVPEQLLLLLRALGAPVDSLADVPGALREGRQQQWRRCCEPVVVAWDGEPAHLELRLPANLADGLANCRLELESGAVWRWTRNLDRLPVLRYKTVEGTDHVVRKISLPAGLPPGYHRFTLDLPTSSYETLIIAAPRLAYSLPDGPAGRTWGAFLPLYALHSGRSWAAGDLTDLEALVHWVQGLGGGLVGTLPLLAAFLDEPFEPSPYAPASRLFWNEFYLDPARAPEYEHCPGARDLLNSPAVQEEISRLRATPLVDYRRGMALKRPILEQLADYCLAGESGCQEALTNWAAENPAARDYARFRAAVETRRSPWQNWPGRMQSGTLQEGDYDPQAARYHLYVQYLLHRQLQQLSGQARRNGGPGLYLDLSLGVHRGGYDVWRERASFALGASSGAPPDMLFTEGQDWQFPPLHPERIREQGYRYFIACLRNHLRYAGILRLDHVMGLHRLFWIPGGLSGREGMYVRYQAEEFYAIIALESQRHHALIVGEDLGNVPPYVRPAMARHKFYRMYVQQTEISPEGLNPISGDALACLNTHDMPPFTSFWLNRDSAGRQHLAGYLRSRDWLKAPTNNLGDVLRASLLRLAASQARIHLLNLEDLWLETAPQNIPGTTDEYPNWRRRARYSLEEFSSMPGLRELLQKINHLRTGE